MKIIVAEDDLVSGKLMQKLLVKQGHEALLAGDGAKALDLFHQDPTRLMITDWMMPEMDGLELCRRIRSMETGHYVYIILLTAKSEKADAVAGLEAGADDYIVKPFVPEELQARIRSGLRVVELEDRNTQAHLQLVQAEKMASVGQLAAGIAHEINNPIGFIRSNLNSLADYQKDLQQMLDHYVEMSRVLYDAFARKTFDPQLPKIIRAAKALEEQIDLGFIREDARELINDCIQGADRIQIIVQQMRDFAYPGEDEAQLEDINKAVENTLAIFSKNHPEPVRIETDFGELPRIRCMGREMNQVFLSIIENAAEAIDDGGLIRISTGVENDAVRIRVCDNGKGIAEKDLGHVFDPFFTTKPVGQGTGLSLHMAFKIVERHKGTLQAESTPGKGACFTICLPVSDPDTDQISIASNAL